MTAVPALSFLPAFEPGTVWLVGAGPGDPGLLTLLAAKALAEADVIVHDALVDPAILDLAGPAAVLEDLGKRAGRPSPTQEAINARLVELAGRNLRVLRLKGGDPFVFGRGGEECLALAEAGLPFRVVPGVTAGIGGLAYAGIPVTHRGLATTATFVTGHDRSGALPETLDFDVLAKLPGALVFYMALGTLEEIAQRLVAAGKPPMTPVAIVSSATTQAQSVIETNLAHCGRDAVRLQPRRPAIVAIGEVVRLRGWITQFQQSHLHPRGASMAPRHAASA
ncbi:uroporphyrinogen-III C-methyltransferase [Azospirillum thermophilum]|uniref:uroporphyrinogen-III C-methyltransferase n=1 Tax=Azospirillum thermophilum TaxID=2202148 RepID=A0A2S2CS04_9PROT|nr:uroporphyrinogen-III C-methyltransferase [Azospirillum thermophilum]AWK87077.1 uroporphyrinogen-III C-methyltransferase [Azospirillum thermophilum]